MFSFVEKTQKAFRDYGNQYRGVTHQESTPFYVLELLVSPPFFALLPWLACCQSSTLPNDFLFHIMRNDGVHLSSNMQRFLWRFAHLFSPAWRYERSNSNRQIRDDGRAAANESSRDQCRFLCGLLLKDPLIFSHDCSLRFIHHVTSTR